MNGLRFERNTMGVPGSPDGRVRLPAEKTRSHEATGQDPLPTAPRRRSTGGSGRVGWVPDLTKSHQRTLLVGRPSRVGLQSSENWMSMTFVSRNGQGPRPVDAISRCCRTECCASVEFPCLQSAHWASESTNPRFPDQSRALAEQVDKKQRSAMRDSRQCWSGFEPRCREARGRPTSGPLAEAPVADSRVEPAREGRSRCGLS